MFGLVFGFGYPKLFFCSIAHFFSQMKKVSLYFFNLWKDQLHTHTHTQKNMIMIMINFFYSSSLEGRRGLER